MRPADEVSLKVRIRLRDGMRCIDCDMTNEQHIERYGCQLHVHRTTPGSIYSLDGCVTCCSDCHRERHRQLRPPADRSGRSVNVWVNSRLRGWIDYVIADVTRRTLKEEVILALENHIKSLGFDPGKSPPKPTRPAP